MKTEILDLDVLNSALETLTSRPCRRPDGASVRQAPKPAPKPPPPSSSSAALLPRWEKRDLLARVSVPEVLARFGIKPNAEGFIRCILPGHTDASPSMKVTPNRAALHCFACAQSVNALDAFGILSGHSGCFPELCDRFGEDFGVPPSNGAPLPSSPAKIGASSVPAKSSFFSRERRSFDPAAKVAERAKAAAEDAAAEAACSPWVHVIDYFYSAAVPFGGLPRGVCVWRKSRYERTVPPGSKCAKKSFKQHFTGDGGKTWRLLRQGEELPPLLPLNWYSFASISSGGVLFINEGEKAVCRLQTAGLMATCGHDAGRLTAGEAVELVKLGAFLVIIADADKTGMKTALHNIRQLCQARAKGGEVRGIALLLLGFAYGSKKDAWELIEEGGTAESLLALADSRGVFIPSEGWEAELETLEKVAAVMESDFQARQVAR